MLETLQRDVGEFVASSSFRYGDALSFQVPLVPGVVELPGRHSPAAYLDALGVLRAPKRVLVIGAGNGGLAIECANRGAVEVVIVETRPAFEKALQRVQKLSAACWEGVTPARSVTVITKTPYFKSPRQFDLILWPEAVEEIRRPPVALSEAASYLAPGGRLFIEVCHGPHGWVSKINSWRPTVEALREGVLASFGAPWTKSFTGRAINRTVYLIESSTANSEQVEPAPPVAEPPELVVYADPPETDNILTALKQADAGEFVAPPMQVLDDEVDDDSSDDLAGALEEAAPAPKSGEKVYRCGICDKRGHNARTCPSKKKKKKASAPRNTRSRSAPADVGAADPDDEPMVILDDDFEVDLDEE